MFAIQISLPTGKSSFYRIGAWTVDQPGQATWFKFHERDVAERIAGLITRGLGGFGFPAGTVGTVVGLTGNKST